MLAKLHGPHHIACRAVEWRLGMLHRLKKYSVVVLLGKLTVLLVVFKNELEEMRRNRKGRKVYVIKADILSTHYVEVL